LVASTERYHVPILTGYARLLTECQALHVKTHTDRCHVEIAQDRYNLPQMNALSGKMCFHLLPLPNEFDWLKMRA
jgi:hypothetical protein